MSILSVHIGQCGNQLGAEFFNTVYSDCFDQATLHRSSTELDYAFESSDVFFNRFLNENAVVAKCIQIDMEEKVITRLRKATVRSVRWKYPRNNCVTSKGGSGNNWAYGFYVHGAKVLEQVGEAIQRQLEAIDMLDGLLVTMSLAGGTGSGLGTKVLTQLPDFVPKAPTLAQLVWPYQHGEVSVQSYNAVLTLGHLLAPGTASDLDGVLVHHNDMLHATCTRRLRASNPNCTIGVDQLNRLASHQVAGLLQPVASKSSSYSRRLSRTLFDLCGHPDYRLLQLRCLPYFDDECRLFATETWPQLARHGRQMLLSGTSVEDNMDWTIGSGPGAVERLQQTHIPLLASSVVLRGLHVPEDLNTFSKSFTENLFPRSSTIKPAFHSHPHCFMRYPRSLFIASNGGGTRPSVQSTDDLAVNDSSRPLLTGDVSASLSYASARAWQMFATKAYLHQYERFGLSLELLMDCFAVVDQISHCYSSLTWN